MFVMGHFYKNCDNHHILVFEGGNNGIYFFYDVDDDIDIVLFDNELDNVKEY